ncbi:MAG: PSD1 and planctomycete cytochrome C domain-containing protein [Verrucomicrobiota bacterium]
MVKGGVNVIFPFLIALAAGTSSHAAEKADFAREVRPILSNRCFKCHGPDESTRKGKLRLDIPEAAYGKGESGKIAIVPGKPSESEFIKRLHAADPDDRMPPASAKMELSETEKKVLEQWVVQGADYHPHWAFVAPKKPAGNSIDEIIGKKLAAENFKPSPEAGKYQLIRRVTLDLIGLLPTPEEAEAFVNDASPDAYEKIVDRLLSSPHYGERWARRWLDLARYADTNGYEKDRERQIWPWRDWVIRSLNADMPFDEFTVKQLAGDMLPAATADDITATGFHRNSMLNEEGGADPLEYRYHAMTDRVATTGTTWLGLTVGCAQCHTHKYDPILHTEYFGMMAFLNNADDIHQDLTDPNSQETPADRARKVEALIASLPGKWPIEKHTEAKWSIPPLSAVTTASGESATIRDGTAVFASSGPEKDSYQVFLKANANGIDRLRLETLADPAIPSGGPGRAGNGNFVLSEIEIFTRPKLRTSDWEKISFSDATATAEQSRFPVASAIDGKPETGWAVEVEGGTLKKDRTAIFNFTNPLPAGEREFKITLAQNFGGHHTVGAFRVSLGEPIGELPDKPSPEPAFNRWLAKVTAEGVPWTNLKPATLDSNEPILTAEADDAIFVSGDTSKDDRFTMTFKNPTTGTTALRLEALTDKRLPDFGPGKVYYEGTPGDFFLYNISIKADGKDIRLAGASSTAGDAKLAIDTDNQTGWTLGNRIGKDQTAVFQLAEPLPPTAELTIEMRMGRYYASTLGKFRLSTTNSAKIPVARAFPENADRKTLFRHFLLTAPELAAETKPIHELLTPRVPQRTLVLQERADHPRITRLHSRGEFTQPAQEIQPHVPAFLPPLSPGLPANRLGFAKWLVSNANPLTARVTVNRNWQAFFGTGIVKTLDDFGFQGEIPSNPELLDWLAVTFEENGWSVKKLHRLIVTSATYKQDSRVTPELLEKDPENRLLARGPRFRVEAEMIRDLTLRASGLLSEKLYGPSVRPPQPNSVTETAYGGMSWTVSQGEDRYRRGLYTFAKRSAPFASYQTFDAPTGEACVARREISNTPLQSLVLLNDEVFFENAQALGKRIAAHPGTPAEKAIYAFQRCLTRPPASVEIEKLTAFHTAQLKRVGSGELKPEALMPKNSTAEETAWMTVARILLNLDETITKN